jgi:hypothetical protein
VTFRLFPGRPDLFNSTFVDGSLLFPQMDVWSRSCVDPNLKRSPPTVLLQRAPGLNFSFFGKFLLLKARTRVFSLDKSLSWMSYNGREIASNVVLVGGNHEH